MSLSKITKQKVLKELSKFATKYKTQPNYIRTIHNIQGLEEWYRDLDRQNITEESLEAMARSHEQESISEGRIYVTNNPNYKE